MSFQLKLYNTVIDDVIHNISDSFLDEGVDEQVLQELKQLWKNKVTASKAVEPQKKRTDVPPPNVTKVTAIDNTIKQNDSKCLLRFFQSGVLNKSGPKNVQANGAKSKVQQQQQQQQRNSMVAPHQNEQTNGTAAGGTGALSQNSTTTAAAASTGGAAAGGSGSGGGAGSNSTTPNPLVTVLDPYKLIPIQITLPPQGDAESRVLTIQLPGSVIQNNQLGQMLTASVIQSIMNLPPALASSVLQQHVNTTLQNNALQSRCRSSRRRRCIAVVAAFVIRC